MKRFNITGTCFPEKHYMVDISDRVEIIRGMIEQGDYFCINRGRQYGKTTTLRALDKTLSEEYVVISMSFEGWDDTFFETQERICRMFFTQLEKLSRFGLLQNMSEENLSVIKNISEKYDADMPIEDFKENLCHICCRNPKPLVLLIDEVDEASCYPAFQKFLGTLRSLYLQREEFPTFQSVILAGVHDIKNLKLKIRDDKEHTPNSPWNIATSFDIDMSLSEEGIAKMLEEYKSDTKTYLDAEETAHLIREYTSGYPFLVSRLCLMMHQQKDWSKAGFLKVEKALLIEKNTLFDDLNKKLEQFPSMREMLCEMLYNGRSYSFNPNVKEIEIASMYGIVCNKDGQVAISNRIFETVLYEKFVAEDIMEGSKVYSEAQLSKPEFIKGDELDVPLILERFVKSFKEIYGEQPEPFIEKEGRRLFLLFVKPIINGVGNYYIEAETRDGLRSDLIIDYLGHRYIIEMKIWRGDSYNKRGEKQLSEYLNRFGEPIGYMVSFCFNLNKVPGLKEPVKIGDYNLVEAIV